MRAIARYAVLQGELHASCLLFGSIWGAGDLICFLWSSDPDAFSDGGM